MQKYNNLMNLKIVVQFEYLDNLLFPICPNFNPVRLLESHWTRHHCLGHWESCPLVEIECEKHSSRTQCDFSVISVRLGHCVITKISVITECVNALDLDTETRHERLPRLPYCFLSTCLLGIAWFLHRLFIACCERKNMVKPTRLTLSRNEEITVSFPLCIVSSNDVM